MNELETMLKMQGDFQHRLDPHFFDMDLKERIAFIKEYSIHLNQEINEMLYELPYFKPWKDYSGMGEEAQQIAMQKARMEMIDAWHFFMNIMLGLGFTADEFYKMYCAKNKENHRRQDEGYTADKSYKDQKVEDVFKDGPSCTVVDITGEVQASTDFIAALTQDDGTMLLYASTDLAKLGVVAAALNGKFQKEFSELNEEEAAKLVDDIKAATAAIEGANNEQD